MAPDKLVSLLKLNFIKYHAIAKRILPFISSNSITSNIILCFPCESDVR